MMFLPNSQVYVSTLFMLLLSLAVGSSFRMHHLAPEQSWSADGGVTARTHQLEPESGRSVDRRTFDGGHHRTEVTHHLHIEPGWPSDDTPLSRVILILFSIGLILLLFVYKIYSQITPVPEHERGHVAPPTLEIEMVPSQSPPTLEIEMVPSRIFSVEGGVQFGPPTCAICVTDYTEGVVLCTFPCGHCYHKHCVGGLLRVGHSVCPLCRRDIMVDIPSSS